MSEGLRSKAAKMNTNRGRGRGGGHRDNHDRTDHGGGAMKLRLDDQDRKRIVDDVTKAVTKSILSAFRSEFAQVEDHMHANMAEFGIGLQALLLETEEEGEVHFGNKAEPPTLELTEHGNKDELRVGDAPFILLSTIKEVIDTLAENEHVAGVSQEMVFHEWSTNLDYYTSHVVYLRVPVALQKRISPRDKVGKNYGYILIYVLPGYS